MQKNAPSTLLKKVSPVGSIMIGTAGFSYDNWTDPDVFYPPETTTIKEQLRYYASKFNMLTISSTYESHPQSSLYTEWADIVLNARTDFLFVVVAPKSFTWSHSIAASIKEWDRFWNGYDATVTSSDSSTDGNCRSHIRKGGCKILFDKGVLGCVVLRFPSSFHYSERHVNKILKIMKLTPPKLKFSFVFHHCSWKENQGNVVELFQERTNWCISTSFVENRLVDPGWAGNISSTRTKDAFMKKAKTNGRNGQSILLTTDFAHICLAGTLGPYMGSYDKDNFLERFNKELQKMKKMGITTFCSFEATSPGTTFCRPLPGLVISGFFLNPQIAELPSHTIVDRPCCLHDAFRLQELSNNSRAYGITQAYKRDSEGFVELEFK